MDNYLLNWKTSFSDPITIISLRLVLQKIIKSEQNFHFTDFYESVEEENFSVIPIPISSPILKL